VYHGNLCLPWGVSPSVRKPSLLPYLIGGAALGAAVAFPAMLAWVFLHPPRRRHGKTPRTALGLTYERVRLRTEDGVGLSAWLVPHPEPKGIVVVSHGYSGCRETMLPYLTFLHAAGYTALLYDFRAHGWSGGEKATLGISEPQDLRAALRWVAAHPSLSALPLVLLGESMGASVSLLVAAEEPQVRAVVADCGFARLDGPIRRRLQLLFGDVLGQVLAPPTQVIGERLIAAPVPRIAPEDVVGKLAPRPVFLIHGTRDRLVTPDNAYRLHAAAGENSALWLVEGAGHTQSVHTAPDYAERVVAFLDSVV